MASWRNGSASDSRSEGWGFESLTGHNGFFFLHAFKSEGKLSKRDGDKLGFPVFPAGGSRGRLAYSWPNYLTHRERMCCGSRLSTRSRFGGADPPGPPPRRVSHRRIAELARSHRDGAPRVLESTVFQLPWSIGRDWRVARKRPLLEQNTTDRMVE